MREVMMRSYISRHEYDARHENYEEKAIIFASARP